jgi:hypothetical protein
MRFRKGRLTVLDASFIFLNTIQLLNAREVASGSCRV